MALSLSRRAFYVGLFAIGITSQACRPSSPPEPSTPSLDVAFDQIAREYLDAFYQRHPTPATYLGIHTVDDQLDDYSRQAVMDDSAANREFRQRVSALDSSALSANNQLDREQLLHAIDSQLVTLERVRPWAKDPDLYSSGLTRTAYIMIKRQFASPEERLRHLIAREEAEPAAAA